jgi:hypothetical protein
MCMVGLSVLNPLLDPRGVTREEIAALVPRTAMNWVCLGLPDLVTVAIQSERWPMHALWYHSSLGVELTVQNHNSPRLLERGLAVFSLWQLDVCLCLQLYMFAQATKTHRSHLQPPADTVCGCPAALAEQQHVSTAFHCMPCCNLDALQLSVHKAQTILKSEYLWHTSIHRTACHVLLTFEL